MNTIIFNGGGALPGCPSNWEEAKELENKANEGKETNEPLWSFDCGFKLDFDGPLLSVSSRFYPPKTHYGEKWDGTITLYLLGKEVAEHKIEVNTLDELKIDAETYIGEIASKFSTFLAKQGQND